MRVYSTSKVGEGKEEREQRRQRGTGKKTKRGGNEEEERGRKGQDKYWQGGLSRAGKQKGQVIENFPTTTIKRRPGRLYTTQQTNKHVDAFVDSS